MSNLEATLAHRWTLTEFGQGEHQRRTIDLPTNELIIGRASHADITINAVGVSKRHARISFQEDLMVVEDLNSTNGTFVNGNRIECCTTSVGDLLQFANSLFKVGRRGDSVADGTIEEQVSSWAQSLLLFDRLISERAITPHFQPIVHLSDRTPAGYELLARSELDGLRQPALMFGAAERLGQQAALSEVLREEGMKAVAATAPPYVDTFLNTHPVEGVTQRLGQSLSRLRSHFPELPMTVEIHEAAVTNPQNMREFRSLLNDLDMRLSYDDFGAGQGRLLELTEVPSDVLKFDMKLIRGIDTASTTRQDLLGSLVRIAKDSGSTCLAEGVETETEHDVCCQLGFDLGQGFLYGKPQDHLS